MNTQLYRCDNCSHCAQYQDLPSAKDLAERIDEAGPKTDRECPKCGALCYPVNQEETEDPATLALQRLAMAAYHPDDYNPDELTRHTVDEDGLLDGDGIAQFIWHEVGDAKGDCDEAIHMMDKAISELEQVRIALYKEKHLRENP